MLIRLRPHPPPSFQVRHVSSTVTFTAMAVTSRHSHEPSKIGKLKVPILKSPSHLGHCTNRLRRMYNEDNFSGSLLNIKDSEVFAFTIYDGHGGEQCSSYMAENLSGIIEDLDQLVEDKAKRDELFKNYAKNIGGYWKRWYKNREQHVENWGKQKIELKNFPADDLSVRVPLAYLDADYKFFGNEEKSGSTCTSALIETIYSKPGTFQPFFENYFFNRHTISKLSIAHVGDTRAILVDKEGMAHPLTTDHHPLDPVEAQRLRRYAANFFMTDSFGEERFIALANTRAFGDVNYKDVGVTAEPDFSQYIIGDLAAILEFLTPEEIQKHTIGGLGGDESFIVLCSDGVTNVLTDQEVADIVLTNVNNRGQKLATPQWCAQQVIKFVEFVGGDDNATCLVIRLNGWGRWPNIDRTGELRQARLEDFNPRGER
ncbi:[Pyruvate dehydrogenase [acetyl-transferring]]-phosphatase 2, mitochondrial [Candida viswanathii]|uniref:[Pyruvate dehydrogenase [acetyl-transferring]]-phosphatase 2, mitochondrial n=1 Tax=Candida viswanathii TaxID=5486 RepID=A0A367YJ20_9ASCO|nr:[Pyruvate dehydrogenase [acetyl-transferring]]-phosphatase 2, mitochondrial [Candida viswanathii]